MAQLRTETPIGTISASASEHGIEWIRFAASDAEPPVAALRSAQLDANAERHLTSLRVQLEEYFAGSRREFKLDLDLETTGDFGRRVLEELAAVPYGETVNYEELAARAGSPRAARAVGNAMRRNSWPIVLPCHRVVRSDGQLGGYAGPHDRADRKRYLLELEGALPTALAA